MKKFPISTLVMVLLAGTVMMSSAERIKKNEPRNRRAVEDILKEIGGDHNPEKMSVTKVGSAATDTTYFHIFKGELDADVETYRILIFDNTPRYLGYYELGLEPTNAGKGEDGKGEIVLMDPDGGDEYTIPIDDNGPAKAVRLGGGVTATFVAAPAPEKEEATDATPADAETDSNALPGEDTTSASTSEDQSQDQETEPVVSKKAEYRTWTIRREGQVITFSGIYVETKDRKTIVVMSAKNGRKADILISELSGPDRQYLAELLK